MPTYSSFYLYFLISSLVLFSCAKIGSPTGGPLDKTAPILTESSLKNQSLSVPIDTKEIRFYFDEFVRLDPKSTPLISPRTNGVIFGPRGSTKKYVSVKFRNALDENTTYNINFGGSIIDNNEGNSLEEPMEFAFSTGKTIDQHYLGGNIQEIEGLVLSKKLRVGLYQKNELFTDSTFIKKKPLYLTSVKENGDFQFHNLSDNLYRILAFEDDNNNQKVDFKEEKYAIINQDLAVDQSNLVLSLSNGTIPYKLLTGRHTAQGEYTFSFEGSAFKSKNIEIRPLTDFSFLSAAMGDSIKIWFNPKKNNFTNGQKIIFSIQNKALSQTDTLTILHNLQYAKEIQLTLKSSGFNTSLLLQSTTALSQSKKNKVEIRQKKNEKEFFLLTALLNPKKPTEVRLDFAFKEGENYEITFLEGALESPTGKKNKKVKINYKQAKKENFGRFILQIQNAPSNYFWVELYLKKRDKWLFYTKKYTNSSQITFEFLPPGEYQVKLKSDLNGNEIWDLQNYATKETTEPVYLMNKSLEIKALWDLDEIWLIQ